MLNTARQLTADIYATLTCACDACWEKQQGIWGRAGGRGGGVFKIITSCFSMVVIIAIGSPKKMCFYT